MWFKKQPKIPEELQQARKKAVEVKKVAEEQKSISERLWDELAEIRRQNNIAAAISHRWTK